MPGGSRFLGDVHIDEINAEKLIGLNPDVIILEYSFDEGSGSVKSSEKVKQEFLALPGVSAMTDPGG